MIVKGGAFPFNPFSGEPADDYVRAKVIVKGMYDETESIWPDKFLSLPRMGETIQAEDGRRLTVLEIVHSLVEGRAVVQLEVGVDKNSVTPMEGGGSPTAVEGY